MVNNLDAKISKHAKDIIQKYTSGLFRNATLEFYGIKTARIKELINVELPTIEITGSSSDFIFLLEDDTYLHFEFQTTYNKDDILRFAGYDLRLFERDRCGISTVIIYSANVSNAATDLNIGSLAYNPDRVMMCEYDGNAIFDDLSGKIKTGQEMSDVDMLNLIFLPLMRNTVPRERLASDSIKLAQTIPDKTKRNTCIAAVFAFANRYLDESKLDELLEVLRLTDLATMLVEDAVKDERIGIAKDMINNNESLEKIIMYTRLDESTIKRLQEELDN